MGNTQISDVQALKDRFARNGYLVLQSFVTREECARLDEDIEEYRRTAVLVDVKTSQPHRRLEFSTFHGSAVEENIRGSAELNRRIEDFVNAVSSTRYVELDNKDIGLSVNVTAPGGVFTWHYDRHEITTILYLNEVQGGDLDFYPSCRLLLPEAWFRAKWLAFPRRLVQFGLDLLVRPAWVRNRISDMVSVAPAPGTLVVVIGTRTLHRVRDVRGQVARKAMVFAYDRPGRTFLNVQDYYGYGNKSGLNTTSRPTRTA